MDDFIRQFSWPDEFSTFFFVKVQQIILILKENYSVDFSQPIDRLDPVQLYSSGLFLLVISLLIIITAHYLVYYGISNPIAHFLFTPKKWVSRRSAAASPVARSHLPNTPPKIKLKASPDSKEKSSTVSSAVKSKENILKFNLAFWKAFNYGALFLYGLYFCLYLETDDPWILDYENYIVPIRYYSWPIAIYYHLSMAHYLYGLACLLFEPKLKDFKQMLTHHVVTLGLELCSYYVSG